MLYICILSKKFDLNQALRVSHSVFTTKHFVLTNKNVFFDHCRNAKTIKNYHYIISIIKIQITIVNFVQNKKLSTSERLENNSTKNQNVSTVHLFSAALYRLISTPCKSALILT